LLPFRCAVDHYLALKPWAPIEPMQLIDPPDIRKFSGLWPPGMPPNVTPRSLPFILPLYAPELPFAESRDSHQADSGEKGSTDSIDDD
jgi:hypothetical protein